MAEETNTQSQEEETKAEDSQEETESEDNEDVDWKEKFEQTKAAQEKIASDYKELEASKNRSDRAFSSVVTELSKTGTGYLDNETGKIVIKQNAPEKEKGLIEKIDEKIQALKSKRDSGDIDDDDYVEHLTDLKSQKNAELTAERILKEQQEAQQKQTLQERNTAYRDILSKEFSEWENPNSQLRKEMETIFETNPSLWSGANGNDIGEILKLAQTAQSSLKAQGKIMETEKQARKNERQSTFGTMNAGPYQSDNNAKSVFNDSDKKIMVDTGMSKKEIEKFTKMNSHLLEHNYQTGMPSIAVPMD